MNQAAAYVWTLAGGTDLDKHVGHKIQVTGKTAMGRDGSSRDAGYHRSGGGFCGGGHVGTSARPPGD